MQHETASATARTWVAPRITDLPPLKELTLQTGDVISGENPTFSF